MSGSHSPGVGRYNPDTQSCRKSSPNAKIGREKRFLELKTCHTLKKEVPHAYLEKDSNQVGSKLNGRGFTKEKRFVVVSLKDRDKAFYPSPSEYNPRFHRTVSSHMFSKSQTLRHSVDLNKKRNPLDDSKSLKEGANHKSELILKVATPGPGTYNSHEKTKTLSHVRRCRDNSFTKVKHLYNL